MMDLSCLNKEQKQKLVLGILMGATVLVLYYYLLLQPKFRQLGALFPQVRELRQELTSLKKEGERIDLLREQSERLDQQMRKYQKAIPMESDLAPLLAYLSEEAKSSRVTLTGMEPKIGQTTAGSAFRETLLILQTEGGYHALGLFLDRLETGERLIRVDRFELVSNKKTPREHQMTLELKTYVSK